MKKILLIAVIIIILGGGGYYFYQSRDAKTAGVAPENETPAGGITVKENNTLLGWLKRGEEVDCHIYPAPGDDIIVLAKGGKVRIDGPTDMFGQNESGEGWIMVADGEWVYLWSGDRGMKMDMKLAADTNDATVGGQGSEYSWEDMAQGWQDAGVEFECNEAKLADNLFAIPESVVFTDLADTLDNLNQVRENLPNTPSDPAAPGAVPQIDIEALREALDEAVPE